MNRNSLLTFILLAISAVSQLEAATPARVPTLIGEPIIETQAEFIVLPTIPNGILVVTPCHGCGPRSFRATAATAYRINEKIVSLAELRAAIAARPKMNVNVGYLAKTGELVVVDATAEESTVSVQPARNK